MTIDEIDSFLAIIRYGNMTVAAERIHLGQPSLSRQIQSLEESLGTQLIKRGKGVREVELTPQGRQFLRLAEQWQKIRAEMYMLGKGADANEISFSSFESLISYVIHPCLSSFLEKFPDVRFNIEMQHSYAAAERVRDGLVKGAFVCRNIPESALNILPLWHEEFCLLAGSEVGAFPNISPEKLDPRYEIHITWCFEYEDWHTYWFGKNRQEYITIDQASSTVEFFKNPRIWMVAPVSVAMALAKSTGAETFPLSSSPVRNIYYMYQEGSLLPVISDFLNDMLDYVSDIPGINLFSYPLSPL